MQLVRGKRSLRHGGKRENLPCDRLRAFFVSFIAERGQLSDKRRGGVERQCSVQWEVSHAVHAVELHHILHPARFLGYGEDCGHIRVAVPVESDGGMLTGNLFE